MLCSFVPMFQGKANKHSDSAVVEMILLTPLVVQRLDMVAEFERRFQYCFSRKSPMLQAACDVTQVVYDVP